MSTCGTPFLKGKGNQKPVESASQVEVIAWALCGYSLAPLPPPGHPPPNIFLVSRVLGLVVGPGLGPGARVPAQVHGVAVGGGLPPHETLPSPSGGSRPRPSR